MRLLSVAPLLSGPGAAAGAGCGANNGLSSYSYNNNNNNSNNNNKNSSSSGSSSSSSNSSSSSSKSKNNNTSKHNNNSSNNNTNNNNNNISSESSSDNNNKSSSDSSNSSSSSLSDSLCLGSLAQPGAQPSAQPCFVVYSHSPALGPWLFSYSINGRLLAAVAAGECIHAMCLSEDGRVLLTGGERGLVVLRWALTLRLANDQGREGLDAVIDGSSGSYNTSSRIKSRNSTSSNNSNNTQTPTPTPTSTQAQAQTGQPRGGFPPFDSPIRSLLLTAREQHLVVGLESGGLRVLTHDPGYLGAQVLARLQGVGFLR